MAKVQKEQYLWVFRHPKPVTIDASADYRQDLARALSDVGVQQANALKEAFGSIQFDDVLASPSYRTLQGAALVAGREIDEVKEVHALIPPKTGERTWYGLEKKDASRINFLYDNIGTAALRLYRRDAGDAEVMDRYGQQTWRLVKKHVGKREERNVLVFAHGILLAQTFLEAVKGRKDHLRTMQRQLINLVMNEATGFCLRFVDGKPQDLAVLGSPDEVKAHLEKINALKAAAAEAAARAIAADNPPAEPPARDVEELNGEGAGDPGDVVVQAATTTSPPPPPAPTHVGDGDGDTKPA